MKPIVILVLAAALSGCGGGKTEERDTAAGKILPGSTSDAMLQTDRLQSEAPLAAPKVADDDSKPGEKSAATAEADTPDAAATPDAAPPAAPAANPPAPAAEAAPTP